ncbi:hypothetical protein DY000_02056807 [Brassica cretica]|uniref:Uncharacterized protein n=1 Tax=Brassica cretica TaxID=69181 RepID=A0ABQ7A6F9_BRACR|nr:hypothetical protein DY000_02056807 [Brassica cretica]
MTKKKTPQILKTDTAQKLLHRLGLGAKVSRQTKRRPSDDPLDQKLQAKFDAGRRKQARAEAESASSSKNAVDESEDDDDDDESESKSQAFGKKRQNKSTPR